ncbi:hypothetical protein HK103_006530 [Boothiomyces macroporosus]|uniref:Mannose-P-dolichol utilization defect 1 protein homolog n=1 Tax=Boothiomyces macroporosus TaxID=261099 RepID=A0AAD5UQQ1_9FUNG|nr:hypothetical protein HK103_006530 [Boothiomyces macroporosus]
MQAVENLLGKIVTPQCAKTILAFDFSSLDCYKLAISKGLSIGIVGGAVLVKVPQIINILASGSVFGLSLMSILLESIAIAISLAYNFRLGNPFSTYGEGCFIMIQNVIIIALILSHNRNYPVSFGLSVAGYAFAYSLLHEHIVSASLINTLQYGTIFIGIGSKLPQIYGNFAAKSTGQLSIITTFLQFAGTGSLY